MIAITFPATVEVAYGGVIEVIDKGLYHFDTNSESVAERETCILLERKTSVGSVSLSAKFHSWPDRPRPRLS